MPIFALLLCLFSSAAPGLCAEPAERATQLLEDLGAGHFSAVVAAFSDSVKAQLPEATLKQVWEAVQQQAGPFKRVLGARVPPQGKPGPVIVACQFERAALDFHIGFDAAGKVVSFLIHPHQEPVSYQMPPYADPASFEEQPVIVGEGEWALHGTLTLPKGAGPFPGLVLVHGSGPNDRDETVGANKPFRDLAVGLASRGIAVLRYDKRTLEHGEQIGRIMDTLTVKEETVDDALIAAALLRKTPKIDPRRVFVLGHSLGGMLIPRIGAADPKLAGLIVMAGTTRPFEDVILEQQGYLFSLNGPPSAQQQAQLEEIRKQVARVKSLDLTPQTPAKDLPLGIPARYWLDLRGYNPPTLARQLAAPMLILQGGRDYQVTLDDFQGWKRGLADRKDVTFKLYPALNHLMIAGEGKPQPDEYETPGHVDRAVIGDIAGWVKAR